MSKKSIVTVIVATYVSLYYFPKQLTFWSFFSIPAYVAICSTLVALLLSCRALQRMFTYWIQTKRTPKESVMAVFYAVILVILILFLPMFSLLCLCLFLGYQGWKNFRSRQVINLPKNRQ
jgi:cobalamin synthase